VIEINLEFIMSQLAGVPTALQPISPIATKGDLIRHHAMRSQYDFPLRLVPL